MKVATKGASFDSFYVLPSVPDGAGGLSFAGLSILSPSIPYNIVDLNEREFRPSPHTFGRA